MDPLTTLVTALVLGAAAGLQATAKEVVKSGYAGIKLLISRRFPAVDLGQLEKDPKSEGRRAILLEELTKSGVAEDTELVRQAKTLIATIERSSPKAAEVVGIDLEKVRAGNISLRDIVSSGVGIRAHDVIAKDITVEAIRAGRAIRRWENGSGDALLLTSRRQFPEGEGPRRSSPGNCLGWTPVHGRVVRIRRVWPAPLRAHRC
jgi:hypothetical protein